jgi:hypothetical protein
MYLCYDIDEAFDKFIKESQVNTEDDRHTVSVVVQKYRFQSWAYAVGLMSLLGARKPLHD